LEKAKFISDIIPDYPENWIMEYDSVDIEVTSGGKTMKARGKNNTLSQEQKDILNRIDLAAYIAISVHYKYNNVLDSHIEKNKLNITFRVVPEVEAEFVGGEEKLDHYIKEKGIDKIAGKIPKQFSEVIVNFTVNEKGEIINANIFKTSGSEKVDKLLLDAINSMPKWKPAENVNGKKVKQEFEFAVNSGMIGC
jgi:TonB family protein